MTKIFSVLAICFFVQSSAFSVEDVRVNYYKAVANKELCSQMIENLRKEKSTPLLLAYLGGLQTIWANHVFSPISKLNTFKEGKKNIEQAVLDAPHNVEIRFVRLSVQKNAPGFLGYKSNIKEDTDFIHKNRDQIDSKVLLVHIEALLKQ